MLPFCKENCENRRKDFLKNLRYKRKGCHTLWFPERYLVTNRKILQTPRLFNDRYYWHKDVVAHWEIQSFLQMFLSPDLVCKIISFTDQPLWPPLSNDNMRTVLSADLSKFPCITAIVREPTNSSPQRRRHWPFDGWKLLA